MREARHNEFDKGIATSWQLRARWGGRLRNVEDEQMPASFDYCRQLTQRAEELGFSTTLIREKE